MNVSFSSSLLFRRCHSCSADREEEESRGRDQRFPRRGRTEKHRPTLSNIERRCCEQRCNNHPNSIECPRWSLVCTRLWCSTNRGLTYVCHESTNRSIDSLRNTSRCVEDDPIEWRRRCCCIRPSNSSMSYEVDLQPGFGGRMRRSRQSIAEEEWRSMSQWRASIDRDGSYTRQPSLSNPKVYRAFNEGRWSAYRQTRERGWSRPRQWWNRHRTPKNNRWYRHLDERTNERSVVIKSVKLTLFRVSMSDTAGDQQGKTGNEIQGQKDQK